MKIIIAVLSCVLISLVAILLFRQYPTVSQIQDVIPTTQQEQVVTPTMGLEKPPANKIIPQKTHVFQSFNNCGPASLSMQLSYFGVQKTQEELGQKLRPYQNLQGDNDDKSVTLEELATEAEAYGLLSYHRPNGDLELIKYMIANDIPVVVRTWLAMDEDIGHYRLVRGYDEATQEIIQDDSYQGKDLRYSYEEFIDLWQPFNYEYLVIIPKEKKEFIERVLHEEVDTKTAWQNAYNRALEEQKTEPTIPYPLFNQSVALYYLGKYNESIQIYESVSNQLPRRMFWYQLEPIKGYLELENYEKVFELTDSILNNQNRGYSELYLIRGEVYKRKGNLEAARQEYQNAVFYNQNLDAAREALNSLDL